MRPSFGIERNQDALAADRGRRCSSRSVRVDAVRGEGGRADDHLSRALLDQLARAFRRANAAADAARGASGEHLDQRRRSSRCPIAASRSIT